MTEVKLNLTSETAALTATPRTAEKTNPKSASSKAGSIASKTPRSFRDGSRPQTANANLYAIHSVGTLKGPILFQTAFMYVFFLIVIGSAQLLGWAPSIRIISFVPYIVVCVVLVELSRLVIIFFPRFEVILPFYSTIIPFALICFWSREAHIMVSVLFFCSCMIIYMQSGHPSLQLHVMIYIILFLLIYTIIILIMFFYYVDKSGVDLFYGRILDPEISWGQEITFIICIALLGIAFLFLEKFIKLYATTLVDRSHQIETLEIEKEELRQEIMKYRDDQDVSIDLDAPIQKVIATLQSIQSDGQLDNSTKDQLAFIIKILASNKLYSPNLNFDDKPSVDNEVSSWLHSMLTSTETKKDVKLTGGLVNPVQDSKIKSTRFLPVLDQSVEKQVDALLEKMEEWDFDIFALAELTNGRPLFFITFALFTRHDLLRKFNIPEAKLRRFLTIIEDGYFNGNPYHNSTHAADVVQTLNYFITRGGLAQYVTELDIFAVLVAALIHDYGHQGLNNAYQISVQSDLAVTYNDKSVLENFHTAQAFALLYQEPNNILVGLTDSQRKEIRETIVTMVLATDMAHHFDLLGKFKSKLAGNGFDSKDRKDRLLLMQIAIKAADISNPTKPSYLCTNWASRVMEEFHRQGDAERRQQMPVSAFMDRTKPAEAKCQIGFIDFIVSPLYDVWASFLPDMVITLEHVQENRVFWKKRLEMPQVTSKGSLETLVLDNPSSTQHHDDNS